MKTVVIGAGSYVFAPGVVREFIQHQRHDDQLVLVDINLAAAQALADAGEKIARDCGCRGSITACDQRARALAGADAVILCAAIAGKTRFNVDRDILKAHGLPGQVRECGGLGGLGYSLRSISLVLSVAADMRRHCPDAWLLDVSNPMPRVVTAANRYGGVRALGFCNVAAGGANGPVKVQNLLGRPAKDLTVRTAGLNHFAWLVSVRDAEGRELKGVAEKMVRERSERFISGFGDLDQIARWLDLYGAVACSGVDHQAEWLNDSAQERADAFHGDEQERIARSNTLKAIGQGSSDWRTTYPGGWDNAFSPWEHPFETAIALFDRSDLDLDMINLSNNGHLPELPAGRVVEVPIAIRKGVLTRIPLPPLNPKTATILNRVSQVHELVAEGAATGKRACLLEAVRLDPAVPQTDQALRAAEAIIDAQTDLIPSLAHK